MENLLLKADSNQYLNTNAIKVTVCSMCACRACFISPVAQGATYFALTQSNVAK